MTLEGTADASVRINGPSALIADRAGRLLAVDVRHARQVVDLRIR
jgi:hypothetical protein